MRSHMVQVGQRSAGGTQRRRECFWWRSRLRWYVLTTVAGAAVACAPAGPDDSKLPPEVQDPATLRTPAGALELYRGALLVLPGALDQVMVESAILTDELAALPVPFGLGGAYTALDSRQDLSNAGDAAYATLHRVRAQLREARGFLQMYAPDSSPALRGHLYAAEGYADILLADHFCSGIPLSTVDFDGDYTLAAGSTTAEVYAQAVALFDTALGLTSDSAGFHHLAAVGRGRALLALGRYAEAAAAVAGVPDDYRYQVVAPGGTNTTWSMWKFVYNDGNYATAPGVPSVGNGEGLNGLDYHSSGDPRTADTLLGPDVYGHDMYFPAKYYPVNATVTLLLADGVEARLIAAEAAFQTGSDTWLTTLNALRTDGTFDTQPNANDPNQTDTLWHAGGGGVAGLGPLSDPGTADARVDLLFRERAFWLYLTAHRQGDLRRLIRQYARPADAVYPTGPYPGASGTYGNEIVVPVPKAEQQLNPKYTGCFHRNA